MRTTIEEQRLDALFTALSDRTRRDIVARLSTGEATVKELAEPYAMTMQAVSQHIRVLERSGLISQGRHRQTRLRDREPPASRNRLFVDELHDGASASTSRSISTVVRFSVTAISNASSRPA